MICLLDTDTLIHLIRGVRVIHAKNSSQVNRQRIAQAILHRCQQHEAEGSTLGLSAITVAELEYGAQNSGNYEREIAAVRKILAPFLAFEFDALGCAVAYGEIRSHLDRDGTPIGAMDLLIAAHARCLGAVLVTCNQSHFLRVSDLTCQDWTQ